MRITKKMARARRAIKQCLEFGGADERDGRSTGPRRSDLRGRGRCGTWGAAVIAIAGALARLRSSNWSIQNVIEPPGGSAANRPGVYLVG